MRNIVCDDGAVRDPPGAGHRLLSTGYGVGLRLSGREGPSERGAGFVT